MSTLPGNTSPLQTSFEITSPFSSSSRTYPQQATGNLLATDSTIGSVGADPAQEQRYLEICINTRQYTKTLCEIDLKDIKSDGELFLRIRSEYFRLRKPRSNLWLLKPSGIHFVKVNLQVKSG
jgi:hypothetical protein